MAKWEPRCLKCGCWRNEDSKGYCIHKCKACFNKSTTNFSQRKKHNDGVGGEKESR